MSYITRFFVPISAILVLITPQLAFAADSLGGSLADTGAQSSSGQGIDRLGQFLLQFIYLIDNYLVPLIFALAFIVFLWGIYLYFIQGAANEEKREKGRSFALWGFIGFFIMVSVWGIINLLLGSFGLNNSSRPNLPTFNQASQSSSQSQADSATLPSASDSTGGETTAGDVILCPDGTYTTGTCPGA